MPIHRLALYVLAAGWCGGAGTAWTVNIADHDTLGFVLTTAVQVAVAAVIAAMAWRDWQRGRLVLDETEGVKQ